MFFILAYYTLLTIFIDRTDEEGTGSFNVSLGEAQLKAALRWRPQLSAVLPLRLAIEEAE